LLRIGYALPLCSPVCLFGAQPAPVARPNTRQPSPVPLERALASISTNDLLQHIRVLASDAFEGRAPAARGEELTVNYLVNQFKKLGLKPGNRDGTYIQNVPLMGFTAQPTISFDTRAGQMEFGFPNDVVILSR